MKLTINEIQPYKIRGAKRTLIFVVSSGIYTTYQFRDVIRARTVERAARQAADRHKCLTYELPKKIPKRAKSA